MQDNEHQGFWFGNSDWSRMEKEEVEKLKWIESEKEGRDIGWHRAVWLWTVYHRFKWLKEQKIKPIIQEVPQSGRN